MGKEERKKSTRVTVIKRSCVTGKPVWIYRGKSESHARVAYWKACKKEQTRVRWWCRRVAERANGIMALLESCLSALPDRSRMTEVQLAAEKRLRNVCKKVPECYTEFYNHINATRRRRKRDREIRRQMRERENNENRRYDK